MSDLAVSARLASVVSYKLVVACSDLHNVWVHLVNSSNAQKNGWHVQ